MLQKAVLRLDSTLVACYGLWAKWLRVKVRAGARECTSCSVVDTPVFVVSVSASTGYISTFNR